MAEADKDVLVHGNIQCTEPHSFIQFQLNGANQREHMTAI